MYYLLLVSGGIIIGLIGAVPIGPVNLICIRRSFAYGPVNGFFSGLGAALGDGVFAVVTGFGLTAIAQSGVPQPLEYLVNDVARTHGHMGVIGLGSVVVGDDPALLRELVGHRKLTKLGLWTLAPTVIGSRADSVTTLTALRGAGYAPVPRDIDGAVVVSATTTSVAEPAEDVAVTVVSEFDPDRHARHLIATARQPVPIRKRGFEFFTALRSHGDQSAIWMLSAGRPVLLTHGERTDLVHSAILQDDTLTVWNTATEQYEDLPIDGIDLVEVP